MDQQKENGKWFNWPDSRGWIGIGSFALAVMVIWIMKEDRTIREDEFFQTIATILIANGWISVVAWGYAATKGGGELADKNAQIVANVGEAATSAMPASPPTDTPQDVRVINPPEEPVPTETKDAAGNAGLPESLR